MNRVLDGIDCRILEQLQSDGRVSIVELASRVHLTKTPCSERVRRLERDGVIREYRAILEPARVGMQHLTVVHVNLTRTSQGSLESFNRAVAQIPEVQSCLMIAGPFDYMLLVRTRDMQHFREVLGEQIGSLPGVMQTHSFAVMETVKESTSISMNAGLDPGSDARKAPL